MSENTAAKKTMSMPENGEFCWTEIATDDLETCRAFYREVFGWQYKASEATGADLEYLEFGTDAAKPFGGMFQMKPEWYGGELPKPHTNIYVAVDDVDEAASLAFELGGTIVGAPMDVPNVGRMSQIQDPTGARFFVIKLKPCDSSLS
jgi:predicted enzyme related to lactoylglutathione lyase